MSTLYVDKITGRLGSTTDAPITISGDTATFGDINMSTGKSIKNAAGTALLTEAGVLDNVALGSSVTGNFLREIASYTVAGAAGGAAANASDSGAVPVKIGHCGGNLASQHLPAGGTDGAFEAGKDYLLKFINVNLSNGEDQAFQVFVNSATPAFDTSSTIYQTSTYGFKTDSTAQSTIDSYRTDGYSMFRLASGANMALSGTSSLYTYNASIWFSDPNRDTEWKMWYGDQIYITDANQLHRSSIGGSYKGTTEVLGIGWYIKGGNSYVYDTGTIKLYELA